MSEAKAKWIIPAPEWDQYNDFCNAFHYYARVSHPEHDCWSVWLFKPDWEDPSLDWEKQTFPTQSEARAYAEQRVREALGAEIVE